MRMAKKQLGEGAEQLRLKLEKRYFKYFQLGFNAIAGPFLRGINSTCSNCFWSSRVSFSGLSDCTRVFVCCFQWAALPAT